MVNSLEFTEKSKRELILEGLSLEQVQSVLNKAVGIRLGEDVIFVYQGIEVRTCIQVTIITKIYKFSENENYSIIKKVYKNEYHEAVTL